MTESVRNFGTKKRSFVSGTTRPATANQLSHRMTIDSTVTN